ncbi:MAG: DUF91 domain-containing protein [Clostridia bacterium]|jgi:predicted transport protein|nr:DUF91 domain-containing protein [Clostridia bacterium]MBT7121490.1 DUF91 domain-containing protein [Clostridia bacterium]
MSNIELYSLNNGVTELSPSPSAVEKELQNLIEKNMQLFFGVRFLKSEFSITNGRIDSLGIDENNCPVIFEYKRSISENVINQGLFYLDWLLDHKADFKLLVMEVLGAKEANEIDWGLPCVICIASDFTKYDEHAVNQMQRNIKLVRYKKFSKDYILFESLNAPKVKPIFSGSENKKTKSKGDTKTFLDQLNNAPQELKSIYETIRDYILSMGDDIMENQLKLYVAFKKTKNIICAEIYTKKIYLHLRLNPDDVQPVEGITKDVREIGHWGTGDLEIVIRSMKDFEKIKPLIYKAYEEN